MRMRRQNDHDLLFYRIKHLERAPVKKLNSLGDSYMCDAQSVGVGGCMQNHFRLSAQLKLGTWFYHTLISSQFGFIPARTRPLR